MTPLSPVRWSNTTCTGAAAPLPGIRPIMHEHKDPKRADFNMVYILDPHRFPGVSGNADILFMMTQRFLHVLRDFLAA